MIVIVIHYDVVLYLYHQTIGVFASTLKRVIKLFKIDQQVTKRIFKIY